jgi:hypothetical protein
MGRKEEMGTVYDFPILAHPTFLLVSMKIELSSPLCERGDEGGIDFWDSILP